MPGKWWPIAKAEFLVRTAKLHAARKFLYPALIAFSIAFVRLGTPNIIGFFIAIVSLVIYAMYAFKMRSMLRAMGRTPDKLIMEGIFNKSRNPQSLARTIGLIALGIWGRSFYSLFLAFLWIAINHPYILIEERFLEVVFGDQYLNYCSLTPRYCGLLTPIKRLIKK